MKRIIRIEEIQTLETNMLRCVDSICKKKNIKYFLVCGSVLGAIRHKGPIPWDFDVDITVPLPELHEFCEIMKTELKETEFRILIPGEDDDKNNITTFPRIAYKKINPRKLHIDVFPQIGISDNPEEQVVHTELLTKLKTDYRDKKVSQTETGEWWKRIAKKTNLKLKTRKVNASKTLNEFYRECAKYPYQESTYVTNPCGHYGTKNILPKSFFGEPKRVEYLDMMLPVPEKSEEYLQHYYKNYMLYSSKEEINKMMQYTIEIEE